MYLVWWWGYKILFSQYHHAFSMVKFYSEKLKSLIVLCVLWSLKLVLSRMATKLPFLVLFWFLCSGNATNLFVGSSYSSCWTTKMLILIWRLLVGNVRLLNSKPTLQWKIQKREDSNQGSYMITLSLEILTSKFSNFGHFFHSFHFQIFVDEEVDERLLWQKVQPICQQLDEASVSQQNLKSWWKNCWLKSYF